MNEITNVALPRCIGYDDKYKYYTKLLIFCDASIVAYGVVAYIKLTNLKTKEIKCSFILAKPQLSPLKEKNLSIPRLEFQAAALGARIKSTIVEQVDFQIDNIALYSDSKVTLNCIPTQLENFFPLWWID